MFIMTEINFKVNSFEMEVRQWDWENGGWGGPSFMWSKPRGSGQNYGNSYAVFMDELSFDHDPWSTCYLSKCFENPCEEGWTCVDTYGCDTWGCSETAGFECKPPPRMFIIE